MLKQSEETTIDEGTSEAPARTWEEWRQLAREVLPQLLASRMKTLEETRVLNEILRSRGEALGSAGRAVLTQEVHWRLELEHRVFMAHSLAHTVATAIRESDIAERNLNAVQDAALWFGLVESEEAPHMSTHATPESAPQAPVQRESKPRCPHAHIIRRFAQMAVSRGFLMDDQEGRRAAFSALLGYHVESCANLSADEWMAGMAAMRDRRMSW